MQAKKIKIFTLIATAIISLSACSSVTKPKNAHGALSVVATIFAPFDFARAVAGGRADVSMLLPPAAESHSFEPSPKDIVTVQNCDVFIYVGGESDSWIDSILGSFDTSDMAIVTLMDCVDVVKEEIIVGMQDDGEDGEEKDEGEEYDEHVWTSPKNAVRIVEKIALALSDKDHGNADSYAENAQEYILRLRLLDESFQRVVDNGLRKTIVFGDRFPFRYFADAYGLTYFAAFPGCSTETEPSAKTVKFLIDKVKDEHIPVVFHIELSNEKMAHTIAEETGANVRLLSAVHNISKADFERGVTYLDLMTENVSALKEALN